MDSQECTTQLVQFRQRLYQHFNNRADTLMELIDALCSNPTAQSVVELSLTPRFRRTYTALYKAVAECDWSKQQLARLVVPYLPRSSQRPFWLQGMDIAPQPRPYDPHLSRPGNGVSASARHREQAGDHRASVLHGGAVPRTGGSPVHQRRPKRSGKKAGGN